MRWLLLGWLSLASCEIASARGDASPAARDGKKIPPQVFTACENKQEGDTCSFVNKKGKTKEGRCQSFPGYPLACKPNNPPRGDESRGREDASR